MKKLIAIFLVLFATSANSAVYLDGSTSGCSEGSTNYAPATRTCGAGSDTVYLTLANFQTNYVAGATNYIRAGNYFRDSGTSNVGSLHITRGGSSGSHTIIKAYTGEERQAVIGTATRGATYTDKPYSSIAAESVQFYPNHALVIYDTGANYTTIDGLKVYGETLVVGAHDVTLKNSDFGGGGDDSHQGNVIKLNAAYNVLVQNNSVHNSVIALEGLEGAECTGACNPVPLNGAGIIVYRSTYIIENNTFYDNFGPDIFSKDYENQAGRDAIIRNNYFDISDVDFSTYAGDGETNVGVRGSGQQDYADNFYVYQNVFRAKAYGIKSGDNLSGDNSYYNNTFINCDIDIGNLSGSTGQQAMQNNNLYYHASTGDLFYRWNDITAASPNDKTGDYNIFYGSANWYQYQPSAVTYTTLANWKTASSIDTNSITSDPALVNASGTAVTDFKRSSYAENFTGSSYGVHAGAYETGSESIGSDWTGGGSVVSAVLTGATLRGGTIVHP
jgi:hypothetical protein